MFLLEVISFSEFKVCDCLFVYRYVSLCLFCVLLKSCEEDCYYYYCYNKEFKVCDCLFVYRTMTDSQMVANPQIRERKQEGTPSNPDTFLGVDAYTVPQGIDAAGMENAVIDAQKKINQKRDT